MSHGSALFNTIRVHFILYLYLCFSDPVLPQVSGFQCEMLNTYCVSKKSCQFFIALYNLQDLLDILQETKHNVLFQSVKENSKGPSKNRISTKNESRKSKPRILRGEKQLSELSELEKNEKNKTSTEIKPKEKVSCF